MRKVFRSLICFVVLIPLPASAGLIHGSIRESGGPASNRPIEIVCPDAVPIPTNTDNQGDYRVFVSVRGQCETLSWEYRASNGIFVGGSGAL